MRGLAVSQTTCTAILSNSSANKRVKQATLQPMVFRQPATDARAPVTNSEHCGSDWLLHKLLTAWCSCWCPNQYTSVSHYYNFYAQGSVAVGFVDIQAGCLQLLLTQTWVKCTSLDSSRCAVYSGIRFKAIRAVSKKLEQGEW